MSFNNPYQKTYLTVRTVLLTLFLLIIKAGSSSIHAQQTFTPEMLQDEYFRFSEKGALSPSALHVQLLLITSGTTITNAFGHVALRVYTRPGSRDGDYYIDFGNYSESLAFVIRFLKGKALFYTNVVPTNWSLASWTKTGRGVLAYEIRLNDAEKTRFLKTLDASIRETENGYEYHNFENNCVTYIRNVIERAVQSPVSLSEASMAGHNTWRSRVWPYSERILWLQIGENFLFNYRTDEKRNGRDLVYLPYDLKQALLDMGRLGPEQGVLNDHWQSVQGTSPIRNWFFLALTCLVLISQIPGVRKASLGRKFYAWTAGGIGILVWSVSFLTDFDFMSKNALVLVFTPADFLLARTSLLEKFKTKLSLLALTRIAMGLIAGAMAIFMPQQVFLPLAAGLIFWLLFFVRIKKGYL